MNQSELIDVIAEQTGLPKKAVGDVLRVQGEAAATALSDGDGELVLPGIGKLKLGARAARTGRNPKTGEALDIPACNVVKLVAAKALKDAVA